MWNDICCCKCGSATSGFPSLVLACVFIVTAHAMTFIITIMMTIMMVNIEFNIWCHDDQHDSIGSDSLNCPLFGFWQKWQRFPNSEVFLENHIHCKLCPETRSVRMELKKHVRTNWKRDKNYRPWHETRVGVLASPDMRKRKLENIWNLKKWCHEARRETGV